MNEPVPAPKRERRERRASTRARGLPRLLFQRAERGIAVLGAAETIAQMREDLRATSPNNGNMVHLEAPAKLLAHSRRTGTLRQIDGTPETTAAIDRDYDGIVLGFANMIRSHDHLDAASATEALAPRVRETAWLSQTKSRIYVLGIGIQDELEPRVDAIDPRLYALLKVINDRAAIFGVRGRKTEAWLHAVGLTNAVALGCPSMFVYPRNVMSIRPPAGDAALRIATAGRLQRNDDADRMAAINRIGGAFDTSYIFQNDFYALFRADHAGPVYNDATGEVDADSVRDRATKRLGLDLTFRDYWMFRSTEKWRGFTTGKDAYFGDRFHGGVVFLQSGRPTIIVQNDARVSELTDFYGIPTATTADILAADPVDLLRDRLSAERLAHFRATYLERYRAFQAALTGAGLNQFNPIAPDDLTNLF